MATLNVETVDVTIVGGGPTGLFTGLLLHRLGVSVRIIDAKPQSLVLGRADALNARTQQYFEVAKLLDGLLPLGLKCNTSSTFSHGEFKSRQNEWWVGLEHTLHKNFLMIGQPVVEKMLEERLQGIVWYGEEVVSMSEADGGVEVVTSSGKTVRSRFAVGADGAKSTVRREIGVGSTDSKPHMVWAVLDTFLDTDFPTCPEIITFELDGQARVSWIPRERGLSRFYVLLDGDVTQERALESIQRHMAPYRVEFPKVEWFSTFDVNERVASSFLSQGGHIVLAGDAAHVHAPNGGQGQNAGLADAFGLAWRLAAAVSNPKLKANAVEKLIHSYDIERRNTARGVVSVAAALVRKTIKSSEEYVSAIERNAGYITGMGVSYDGLNSPLVTASEHGIWKAGCRCPDVVLKSKQGDESTRLYSETTYGKFLLLFIGSHQDTEVGHHDVAEPYYILPEASGRPDPEARVSGTTRHPPAGKAFTADWVEGNLCVLVRPDMYIGWVGRDAQGCKEYLDELYD